jgi:alpha-mannosidase
MTQQAPVVFVLRHTHWDREWYHPAPRFRKRLVDLIDDLLVAPPNAPFLLDGQAIVLRDYLEVRPERAAELSAALRDGRLEAGPWFVLPDELIPSGEALVRNLLVGKATLRASRAQPPPVLYCPDSFGHPAALPAIAAGFGFRSIIAWRGYGSRRFPPGDTARWRAPNGADALLFHLPPDGYEFGSRLPTSEPDAQRRWAEMRRVLERRSALGVWLVPNGADHHAPQGDGTSAIAALARAAAPIPVQVGGLAQLAQLLEARAAAAKLPDVTGELRDSYGYTWTLGGTLATRAHQKRANAQVERDLVRDVEPWAALARLRGAPSSRHHVRNAWEVLLMCHPHDSLCGCSVDAVAHAVDLRLADAAALVRELREASIAALIGHDADAAREQPSALIAALLVRNRAARPRAGVAEVDLDVALAYVPIGPGSAGRATPVHALAALDVPVQVLSRERRYVRIEAPGYYPINHEIERRRCLVWMSQLPAYGMVALPLGEKATRRSELPGAVVRGDARAIRSAVGSLTIGRTALAWRAAGAATKSLPLFSFEIVGDRGDTYTHAGVPGSAARARLLRARVALRGPLRAAIDSTWRVAPSIELRARAALDAGTSFVRLRVDGENRAKDHRLRIILNTGLRPRRVFADAAFAMIERKPLEVPARDRVAETPPRTAPLHRFVSLLDGMRGCTVVSDGLAEYEVLDDGAVAITLVRAVAELSRATLAERPGHAGWPAPTPAAQCPGPFAGEFAIAWHAGDSPATRAAIIALVDDALLPLAGDTQRDLRTLPAPTTGVTLEGNGLAFSSLKESEDGANVVARCVNLTGKVVHGAWVLPQVVAMAQEARLDETPIAALPLDGTRIPIVVPPHGIHSVLISTLGAVP